MSSERSGSGSDCETSLYVAARRFVLPDVAASFAKADVEAELHEPALVQKRKINKNKNPAAGSGPERRRSKRCSRSVEGEQVREPDGAQV